jgi:hypothetical protein
MLIPTTDSDWEPAVTAPYSIEAMSNTMMKFLESNAIRPRTFEQAIEPWRSNCPRLTTWEDGLTAGLIAIVPRDAGTARQVRLTTGGLFALRTARRDRFRRQTKQDQQKGRI